MPSGYVISYAAKIIGDNGEFVKVVSANSYNIDDGEMLTIWISQENGSTAYSDRGIECPEEFNADLRRSPTGMHNFLVAENCPQETITRIIAEKPL